MELPEEPKVGVAFGAESLQKKLGPFKGPFNGVNQQEIHDFFPPVFVRIKQCNILTWLFELTFLGLRDAGC